MKEYYSIRYEITDSLHKAGEQVFNADNVLRIGQTESCDVRLVNYSQYEDAVLAIIEKRENGEGWKLIRTSPYKEHEVRVNGTPFDYVHFLSDGDRIAFEGQSQELLFNVRHDDLYAFKGIVMTPKNSGNRTLKIWMLIITLLLSFVVVQHYYNRSITPVIVEKAKQSVLQIKVDSVKYLKITGTDTVVLGACEENAAGIVFLTDDSKLVTARHCIEPWLNIPDTMRMDPTLKSMPLPVKWALEAVTHEVVEDDDSHYQMVSFCSIYQLKPDYKYLFSVKSTDFIMDKSRDHIVEYGDFNHQYFWRSISARPRRVDMMMGDIAYLNVTDEMPINKIGVIHLASKKDIQSISDNPKIDIAILGCPNVIIGKQEIECSFGSLKKKIRLAKNGNPEFVIAHDGNLAPGYSGGPVLTKQGFKWYAIGVVSVTDKFVKGRFYSVPVTEINKD